MGLDDDVDDENDDEEVDDRDHQDDGADQWVGEEANGVTEGRGNLLNIKHMLFD